MLKTKIRLCTLQPELVYRDPEGNFARIKTILAEICDLHQPQLALLPENFPLWGSEHGKEYNTNVALEFLQNLASEFSLNLIGGSFHCRDAETGDYYNTCYVLNDKGEILGRYHKRKLFHRELNYNVKAGAHSLIVEILGWKIAVQICADFWFPELSREIFGEFDLLAVPAQSVVRNRDYQPYGRILWHNLALTRAQENACVTVVSDHPAMPQAPYCSGGASICDPSRGAETADLDKIHIKNEGNPGFICQDLDLSRLRDFRKYRMERGLLPVAGIEQ